MNGQFIPLFFGVITNFRSALEKRLTEIGLHSGQVFVLSALWQENGLSQIELAQRLNISPPTVYKMVRSLEKNGFVISRRSTTDRRKTIVVLSDKGVRSEKPVGEIWRNFEEAFLQPLTDTERLVFQQLLEKLSPSA